MVATKFNSEKSTIYTPHTFRTEITELHSLYEKILFQITSFPKAGEINWRVLEMVDQVMSDWDVLGGGTAGDRTPAGSQAARAIRRAAAASGGGTGDRAAAGGVFVR